MCAYLNLGQAKLDVVPIRQASEVVIHVLKDHVDAAFALVLLHAWSTTRESS